MGHETKAVSYQKEKLGLTSGEAKERSGCCNFESYKVFDRECGKYGLPNLKYGNGHSDYIMALPRHRP
jgi:hypothetical protein